jgi:4-amino-4-deoxy-L-arabinose transferase-like glycosyltransferase
MRARILLLSFLTSVWLISSVALLVRLTYTWNQQRLIPHAVLATLPFAQENGNIAFALSEGKGFSNVFRQETGPTAWLAPVYPVLLSGIFRVFGPFTFRAFLAAAILNCLFSAATCIPIYLIGKKVGGAATAALAAWLWAIYPHAVLIPFSWIWDTSLSALLAATLLCFTLQTSESRGWQSWLAYGFLWGLALLTNPALGAAFPFFLVWLFFRSNKKAKLGDQLAPAISGRFAWKFPALALAVVILVCVPWTLRNYAQFHRFVPLRSDFPFELWLGNNSIFDPHAVNGIQRITKYEQVRLYAHLGETAFLQEKWLSATQFMRTHPALELRLTAQRIEATWLGTEHPLADFLSANSLLTRVVFLCNLVVLVGTLCGLSLLFLRRSPYAFPLAVFPLFFPLVYYVTHTSLRYRHPADPALLVLLAVALLACFPSQRRSWAGARE